MELAADVDLARVEAAIASMTRAGRSLGKPMKIIRKELRFELLAHARKAEGPDGPWKPRATRKGSDKRRKGRARRLLGRLPTSVTYTATAARVVARSRVRWSGVHQDGATVGRGAKVEARPFLWLSPQIIATAARVLERFVAHGWG